MLPTYEKHKVPYSDYLFHVFTTQFDTTIYGLKSEFEELFDWFKLYQAMAFFQNTRQLYPNEQNLYTYVGRNGYSRTKQTKYAQAFQRDETIDAFIKAGFIKNTSDPLYREFLTVYNNVCKQLRF